jgi:hypothetical protein
VCCRRDSLSAAGSDIDQGIILGGKPNLVPTDSNGLVFARDVRQVSLREQTPVLVFLLLDRLANREWLVASAGTLALMVELTNESQCITDTGTLCAL